MSETRLWVVRGLITAALLGAVAWLASWTEWAEVELPLPPRGEAARNPLYATQQLARRLGSTVATPASLSQLPPEGATLLLTSWYWDLFPERAQRLKAWVEQGGHLVLYAHNLNHEQLAGWLPIQQLKPARPAAAREHEDDEDDDPGESAGEAAPPAQPQAPGPDEPQRQPQEREQAPPRPAVKGLTRVSTRCHDLSEPQTVAPYYAEGRLPYKLCGVTYSGWKLQASTPVLWSLQGPEGALMLRAAKGRGQVTVIQPWGLLDNERVLKADNGLAAIAALKAGPGAQLWFVTEEARPGLLRWLWQQAWVAVLLGALALGLALWRGARRFGPLAAKAVRGRRSMAEQIAGTAEYLRHQAPEALLAAQVRALDAAARLHVLHYDRLDRGQRAAAIARHTGLQASALGLALDKSLARRRANLSATLELLETARRLLAQKKPTPGA